MLLSDNGERNDQYRFPPNFVPNFLILLSNSNGIRNDSKKERKPIHHQIGGPNGEMISCVKTRPARAGLDHHHFPLNREREHAGMPPSFEDSDKSIILIIPVQLAICSKGRRGKNFGNWVFAKCDCLEDEEDQNIFIAQRQSCKNIDLFLKGFSSMVFSKCDCILKTAGISSKESRKEKDDNLGRKKNKRNSSFLLPSPKREMLKPEIIGETRSPNPVLRNDGIPGFLKATKQIIESNAGSSRERKTDNGERKGLDT